jgi:hypothetical protein
VTGFTRSLSVSANCQRTSADVLCIGLRNSSALPIKHIIERNKNRPGEKGTIFREITAGNPDVRKKITLKFATEKRLVPLNGTRSLWGLIIASLRLGVL